MTVEQNLQKCPHLHNQNDISGVSTDPHKGSTNTAITREQNMWHVKGNNGCIFSQVIASNVERYNWQKSIIAPSSEITGKKIDAIVKSAIDNPEVRLLSLIFPTITDVEDLAQLCEVLATVTETIFLLEDTYVDGLVALSFRAGLENDQILAWIMGFGPFDFFAETRQAPYTELIIPVKKKPEDTYHRHSQDKSSAHVADQHIPLDDKVLDRIWVNTFKKTQKVLGHTPNIFSGARTTVTLPESHWPKTRQIGDSTVENIYSDQV